MMPVPFLRPVINRLINRLKLHSLTIALSVKPIAMVPTACDPSIFVLCIQDEIGIGIIGCKLPEKEATFDDPEAVDHLHIGIANPFINAIERRIALLEIAVECAGQITASEMRCRNAVAVEKVRE